MWLPRCWQELWVHEQHVQVAYEAVDCFAVRLYLGLKILTYSTSFHVQFLSTVVASVVSLGDYQFNRGSAPNIFSSGSGFLGFTKLISCTVYLALIGRTLTLFTHWVSFVSTCRIR